MKKVLVFLGMAIAVQGVSAVTGLLLTRWLTIADYSIYTVIISISAAMTTLTRGGVNLGLTTILGRTWPDKKCAYQALGAADQQRKRLSYLLLPLVFLTSIWLLQKNGATFGLTSLLISLLAVQWWSEMATKNKEQILLFANRANILQALESIASILRVVMVGLAYFFGILSVFAAFVANVFAMLVKVYPINRMLSTEMYSVPKLTPKEEDVKEIRLISNRQLPMEIFYVMQLQIILIIISVSGSQGDVASFGALSRIGQLLSPIVLLINAYVIPRFAQCKANVNSVLLYWFFISQIPGLFLIIISAFLPEGLLWLIGSQYAGLQYELFVFCIGVVISNAATIFIQLVANRGLNRYSYLQVPIVLSWVLIATVFFDLSILANVLWMLAFVPIGQLIAGATDLIMANRRGEI